MCAWCRAGRGRRWLLGELELAVGEHLFEIGLRRQAQSEAAQIVQPDGRAAVTGQLVAARRHQGARHFQTVRMISQKRETHDIIVLLGVRCHAQSQPSD